MKQDKIKILKALGDETRFAIVCELLNRHEMSCADVTENFNLSQPTMSHHLTKLVAAGIVNARKDKIWSRYSLNRKVLENVGIDPMTFLRNES